MKDQVPEFYEEVMAIIEKIKDSATSSAAATAAASGSASDSKKVNQIKITIDLGDEEEISMTLSKKQKCGT
eukprot:343808-Amphidinium_carterae.1